MVHIQSFLKHAFSVGSSMGGEYDLTKRNMFQSM